MPVIPYDGVHQLQNVYYPEQHIGLRDDVYVVGRQEGTPDPRIEWNIKARIGEFGDGYITISTSDNRYIGVVDGQVVLMDEPYEWGLSYRNLGKFFVRSHLGKTMFLYDGADGTKVGLQSDPVGDVGYWRFIPIRNQI